MSITRVTPPIGEASGQAAARAPVAPAVDFAAVARSVAAGDLEAARRTLAAGGAPAASTQTLAQTLAEGNLAAARLALAQLGANAFDGRETVPSPQNLPPSPPVPTPNPVVASGPSYAAVPPDTRIAAAVEPPSPASANGMVIADVGAALASASGNAPLGSTPGITPVPGGTVTSANGNTYAVADVLLALAVGNAGGIPADVINLYGPGGARYDPGAIMDAYRNSTVGQAQIAALSWIGRPAQA